MFRFTTIRLTLVLLLGSAAVHGDDKTISDFLKKPSLNAVIIVSDMAASQKFYGDVLGLEAMSPIPFGPTTAPVFFPKAVTMQRYRVGTHEIKLLPGWDSTVKKPGGIGNATGFRMINFPILDMDAFRVRLKANGYPEPKVNAMGTDYRFGMLEDPDGNQVEFYYYEKNGPDGWQESIQYALTVSDVEATRHFYGTILGMQEMPPVPMPGRQGTNVYLFRNGPTIIKFWSFGKGLPNQGGRHNEQFGFRYIQYEMKDVHATHEWVKARGAKMEMKPTSVVSLPVDIMFVAAPDNIIQEMFSVVLPGAQDTSR